MKRDPAAIIVGLLCLTITLTVLFGPPRLGILAIAAPATITVIGLIGLFLVPRGRGSSTPPKGNPQ